MMVTSGDTRSDTVAVPLRAATMRHAPIQNFVFSRAGVRALDKAAIEEFGIPGVILMETAAIALAEACISPRGLRGIKVEVSLEGADLFSESQGRAVVACPPATLERVLRAAEEAWIAQDFPMDAAALARIADAATRSPG